MDKLLRACIELLSYLLAMPRQQSEIVRQSKTFNNFQGYFLMQEWLTLKTKMMFSRKKKKTEKKFTNIQKCHILIH